MIASSVAEHVPRTCIIPPPLGFPSMGLGAGRQSVRVLAIYYDVAEMNMPRCSIFHLLAGGHIAEVRFVGETLSSVRLVRTLVRAGRYKRPSGPGTNVLWVPGDECYPFPDPFIFIRPDPEPAAFV
jgi:hypothetical protein